MADDKSLSPNLAGLAMKRNRRSPGQTPALAKARHLIDELGAVDAVLYTLDRAWRRFARRGLFYRYELVAQPVAAAPRLPARRGASIETRRLDPGDSALAHLPLGADVLAARFAQGAVCLGAFKEGRVIGCLWFVAGAYEEDEVRCRFVPEGAAAWDFDLYLAPEARGGLGFARLWDAADAAYREAGIRWSMSRISRFNAASLASHRRVGARSLGRASFVVLGPAQLMLATLPPFVHLGVRRRPVLRLAAPE